MGSHKTESIANLVLEGDSFVPSLEVEEHGDHSGTP